MCDVRLLRRWRAGMRQQCGFPLTPALSPAAERQGRGASIAGERGTRRRLRGLADAPAAGNALPRGFTLLEVIIALSLSVLLLTAVYGAIRMQYRLSQSGREQMEQAQLSRAILRLIESDVRSVVWQVQKPPQSGDSEGSAVDDEPNSSGSSGSTGTSGSSGSTSSSTFGTSSSSESGSGTSSSASSASTSGTSQLLTGDAAFAGGSTGISGDSQNLVLSISRPAREMVYATSIEDEADAAGRSELASVSYFIADGSAGGVSAAVASQNGGGSSVLGGVVGLARMEGDRLSMMLAGNTTAVDAVPGAAKVIAPEVVAIEFAYWDGLEWLASWDSAVSGTLPSAIGITLSIDTQVTSPDRTLSGRVQQAVTSGQSAQTGEPVQVRYVIAVPLAEPYVSEASI
jgi:prepilin-type N-terminal cleavage/methylation domain-containing protein